MNVMGRVQSQRDARKHWVACKVNVFGRHVNFVGRDRLHSYFDECQKREYLRNKSQLSILSHDLS